MACIYTPLSSSALQVERVEDREHASIVVQVGLRREGDNRELAEREDVRRYSFIDMNREEEKEKKEENLFVNDDVEGMELMIHKKRSTDEEDIFSWIRRQGSSYFLYTVKKEKVGLFQCAKIRTIHHQEKEEADRPATGDERRTAAACLGAREEIDAAKENLKDLKKFFFSQQTLPSYPGRQDRDRKKATTSLSSSSASFLSSDKDAGCVSSLSNIFHSSSLASFSLQLPFENLSFLCSFLSAQDTDLNLPCQDDASPLSSFSLRESFSLSGLSSFFCFSPNEERTIIKVSRRRGGRRSARRRRARRRSSEKTEWICPPSSPSLYLSSQDSSDDADERRLKERDLKNEGKNRVSSSKARQGEFYSFSFLLHGDEGIADSALLLSLLDRTDEEDLLLESFASFLLANSFSFLHRLHNLLLLEKAHPLHQFYLST